MIMLIAKAHNVISISESSSVYKLGSDNDNKASITPSKGLMCSIAESLALCTVATVSMTTSGDCRDGIHVIFGPQQPDDANME